MSKFIPSPHGYNNELLQADGWYVSYNKTAGASKEDALGDLAQLIGGIFTGEGEPQEETALYDGKKWRILKGDYRKEYEQAFPDWDECLKVYHKHIANRSEWSTDQL